MSSRVGESTGKPVTLRPLWLQEYHYYYSHEVLAYVYYNYCRPCCFQYTEHLHHLNLSSSIGRYTVNQVQYAVQQ